MSHGKAFRSIFRRLRKIFMFWIALGLIIRLSGFNLYQTANGRWSQVECLLETSFRCCACMQRPFQRFHHSRLSRKSKISKTDTAFSRLQARGEFRRETCSCDRWCVKRINITFEISKWKGHMVASQPETKSNVFHGLKIFASVLISGLLEHQPTHDGFSWSEVDIRSVLC